MHLEDFPLVILHLILVSSFIMFMYLIISGIHNSNIDLDYEKKIVIESLECK